jgi:alpha-1,2-mannosyltransferase
VVDLGHTGERAWRGHPASGWLLLVLLASAAIDHVVVNPGRNNVLDARSYWAAGRAWWAGVNPYDTPAVRAAVGLSESSALAPYVYPPPALLLLLPFSLLPCPAAQVAWCAFQFLLLLAALGGLARLIGCELRSPLAALLGVSFVLSAPVAELFRWGQFDMVIVALLVGALLAFQQGRPATAGVLLALAAAGKVTPALCLLVLPLRGEYRALGAAMLTLALLAAWSVAFPGPDVCAAWVANLRELATSVPAQIAPQNMSLRGFTLRAFAAAESASGPSVPWLNLGLPAARVVSHALVGALVLVTLVGLARSRRWTSTSQAVAATVPLMLLISPVTWTHHGVVLLIPLALLGDAVFTTRRVSPFSAAIFCLSLLLYMQWPVQRYQVELAPWLAHLAGPTPFYATLLVWLLCQRGLLARETAAATRPYPDQRCQLPGHAALQPAGG